jgi:hypothetical protein
MIFKQTSTGGYNNISKTINNRYDNNPPCYYNWCYTGDENFKWMLRIDEKICKIGYNEKEINCNIENIYF